MHSNDQKISSCQIFGRLDGTVNTLHTYQNQSNSLPSVMCWPSVTKTDPAFISQWHIVLMMGIFWVSLEQALANFFCKSESEYFHLHGLYNLYRNYLTLLLQPQGSHKLYVNVWSWQCLKKPLFIIIDNGQIWLTSCRLPSLALDNQLVAATYLQNGWFKAQVDMNADQLPC